MILLHEGIELLLRREGALLGGHLCRGDEYRREKGVVNFGTSEGPGLHVGLGASRMSFLRCA